MNPLIAPVLCHSIIKHRKVERIALNVVPITSQVSSVLRNRFNLVKVLHLRCPVSGWAVCSGTYINHLKAGWLQCTQCWDDPLTHLQAAASTEYRNETPALKRINQQESFSSTKQAWDCWLLRLGMYIDFVRNDISTHFCPSSLL